MRGEDANQSPSAFRTDRREAVLAVAFAVFARYGYRRTSMDEVAREAGISRPGLYFLFSSKPALFRAAVEQALDRDLAAVERTLDDVDRPLADRLLEAFDHWAGRYVGPLTGEVSTVIEDHPGLLDTIVARAPRRFETLLTRAIAAGLPQASSADTARTLISASIGIKHQVSTRDAYLERLAVAVALVLR